MNLLETRRLAIPDLVELTPHRFRDERGFFSEVWNEARLGEAGIDVRFVQDNVSVSTSKGVLRGLHFQTPPAAQAKLVRVSRGAVFDVGVDIRRSSPTFGRWAGVVLSADRWNQLYLPEGFAHGFVTLEDDTEVSYKVSALYSAGHDRSIRWDDAAIAIDWPIAATPIVSARDAAAPALADVETGF